MPRLGYISASNFSQLLVSADIKADKFGSGCDTYAHQLVAERFGVEREEATAASLEWGKEYEWEARERFEELYMLDVEVPRFINHPTIPMVGGTPDGLIGNDGIIEIKCPQNPVYHMRNVLTAYQYHKDYKDQVQGYLWLTGRKYAWFVSFDPRWPESLQLAAHRFERDEEHIELIERRVIGFQERVLNPLLDQMIAKGAELVNG